MSVLLEVFDSDIDKKSLMGPAALARKFASEISGEFDTFGRSENDVPELAAYLRVLMDIGFLNKKNPPIVSFEVKPFGDEDPEAVIANSKRTLTQAWSRV
jgi:hypothetical protein